MILLNSRNSVLHSCHDLFQKCVNNILVLLHRLVKLISSVLASKWSVFLYKRFLPNKCLFGVIGSIKSLLVNKYVVVWCAVLAKLITFIHTKFNFCTTSRHFCTKLFNQHNIQYTILTIFCQHVFLFCATLNIFSQHELTFWVSHKASCCYKILFCDSQDV